VEAVGDVLLLGTGLEAEGLMEAEAEAAAMA